MSDFIPENIQLNILKHFPVQTLLRSRCVCKWWKQVIDSEEFIQEHLALQKPQCLVQNLDDQFSTVELHSPPLVRNLTACPIDQKSFCFVGTLHGVVCLYDDAQNFRIWNPSIRKLSTIPVPLEFESYTRVTKGRFCCNAFWIDPCTKEFKIFILVVDTNQIPIKGDLDVQTTLYSSIKHEWTALPPEDFDSDWFPTSDYADPPVMIAGTAHWKGSSDFFGERGVMMCFDFTRECFEFIKVPDDGNIIRWEGAVSVLCLLDGRCKIQTRQEGLWVPVFSIDVTPPATSDFSVLMLDETKERFWLLFKTPSNLILRTNVFAWCSTLSWYDPAVGCIPLINDRNCRALAFEFVESLLFP